MGEKSETDPGKKSASEETPEEVKQEESAPAPPEPSLGHTVRYIVLAGALVLLGGSYFYARAQYSKAVHVLAQDVMDTLFTTEVRSVGSVSLDAQGNLHMYNISLNSNDRGENRLCFRASELVIYFDGYPLRDGTLRVNRVDLHYPEMFFVRYPDGDWNALHFLKPRITGEADPDPEEDPHAIPIHRNQVPANGVHIYHGTVWFAFRDEEGDEVEYRVDDVDGQIQWDPSSVMKFSDWRGNFYGGELRARAQVPPGPFSIKGMVDIKRADVARMTEGASFIERPVSGTFDAVFSYEYDEQKVGEDPLVAGQATVSEGDLWEFPALLGVLSAFSLDIDDQRKITSGEIRFVMKDNQIYITQLDLKGTPVSLYGEGYVDLTGKNLKIIFLPSVSTGFRRLLPLIGDPIQDLLDLINGAIVPVIVEGSWADPNADIDRNQEIPENLKELIKDRKKDD